MLELHHREGCPFSARIRTYLEENLISYVSHPAPKLGSERAAVLEAEGSSSAEVPMLVDGDTTIQGTEAILEHLRAQHSGGFYRDPAWGLTRKLPGMSYEAAVQAATEALGKHGFGVLTEIDVKATLKKKLDADFRPYIILGACNPSLAHKALTASPGVGLLLPCNVVVTEEDDGTAVVSAIDPVKLFSVVSDPDVEPLAKEVRVLLRKVLAEIQAPE